MRFLKGAPTVMNSYGERRKQSGTNPLNSYGARRLTRLTVGAARVECDREATSLSHSLLHYFTVTLSFAATPFCA